MLATTVLQTCIRYQSRTKTCQFCAIGQSLAAGRTIERKTPAQLAEVAKAAVELDGVKHMVMTTGTPPGRDRGAAILCESALGVKAAVDLPIQGQCEPPDDDVWFAAHEAMPASMRSACISRPSPRRCVQRIMPGKAQVPVERYFEAFAAAVPVFGRGQVSTYILAGLGDSRQEILAICERLVGSASIRSSCRSCRSPARRWKATRRRRRHSCTRSSRRSPKCCATAACRSSDIKAGCGKCGACSALSTYEQRMRGMIFEPFKPFLASAYQIKFATEAWEQRGAAALRRAGVLRRAGLVRRRRPRRGR